MFVGKFRTICPGTLVSLFLKVFLSKFVVNECLTGVNMKRNEHERRGINDNI